MIYLRRDCQRKIQILIYLEMISIISLFFKNLFIFIFSGRNSGTSPPPDRKSLASIPNHSPKTRRKKSLPETQSSGDTFEDSSKLHATTAGLPRTRSSTSLQVLLNQNASPTLQPHEVIVKVH